MLMRSSRKAVWDDLVWLSQTWIHQTFEPYHGLSGEERIKKEKRTVSKPSLTLSKEAAENNLHQSYM